MIVWCTSRKSCLDNILFDMLDFLVTASITAVLRSQNITSNHQALSSRNYSEKVNHTNTLDFSVFFICYIFSVIWPQPAAVTCSSVDNSNRIDGGGGKKQKGRNSELKSRVAGGGEIVSLQLQRAFSLSCRWLLASWLPAFYHENPRCCDGEAS